MDYAQWGTRVLGYIIDTLIVGVIAVLLFLVAGLAFGSLAGLGSLGAGINPDAVHAFGGMGCCAIFAIFPISTLLVGLYNKVYLVSSRGGSIGQGVVKIRVVDAAGRLITPGMALVRLLAHVGLSLLPFGGLIDLAWPLWDPYRQTLHDKAASCYVINWRNV